MSDRLFFGLIAAAAVLIIAFSAIWPQGLGARSPGPFGHVTAAAQSAAAAKRLGVKPEDADKAAKLRRPF